MAGARQRSFSRRSSIHEFDFDSVLSAETAQTQVGVKPLAGATWDERPAWFWDERPACFTTKPSGTPNGTDFRCGGSYANGRCTRRARDRLFSML